MSIQIPKKSFDFFVCDNPQIEIPLLKDAWKNLDPRTRNKYIKQSWNEHESFEKEIEVKKKKTNKIVTKFHETINVWKSLHPTFYLLIKKEEGVFLCIPR